MDCSISLSLLRLMSITSVMPSNHLILCHPLLPPSIFPTIRVFSNELVLSIRWPKYYYNDLFLISSLKIIIVALIFWTHNYIPDWAKHVTCPVSLNPYSCPKIEVQSSPPLYRYGNRLKGVKELSDQARIWTQAVWLINSIPEPPLSVAWKSSHSVNLVRTSSGQASIHRVGREMNNVSLSAHTETWWVNLHQIRLLGKTFPPFSVTVVL